MIIVANILYTLITLEYANNNGDDNSYLNNVNVNNDYTSYSIFYSHNLE